MNYPTFFNAKNSLNLFNLKENFKFISELYSKKNLPKVLMFTGNKGSGKSTLINHFLYSIFDVDNYDKETHSISSSSIFLKQFQNNIFANIIYLNALDYKSVKIEDIRNLKKKILKFFLFNFFSSISKVSISAFLV